MKRSFLSLAFILLVGSCAKKKDDVIALSPKQKAILGKWRQSEIYAPGSVVNSLTDCEKNFNTIFDFRTDGKCYVHSPGNCVPQRHSSYAMSADGEILVIEGKIYYVNKLESNLLEFYEFPLQVGTKQIWRR
jgi:hypothetical protein